MGTRKTKSKSANKRTGNKVLRDLQATDKVIAIFAADVHLTHKPPVWRSAEPDWYAAMKRPLDEIAKIQKEYNCPIIYAGDIFDRWNSPAELINFAIDNLPTGYAIPGQHDLPLHNLDDIEKSAYWTLCKSGILESILLGGNVYTLFYGEDARLFLTGVPYSWEIPNDPRQQEYNSKKDIHIAVAHEYKWIPGHTFPGAPEDGKFGKRISGVKNKKWLGYDIVVYGDNHKGFMHQVENTQIFNCGTLMRRKSDEIDYRPQIGLLLDTGKIISHKLDISKDKYLISDKPINEDEKMDLSDFIAELELLGDTALDFEVAVDQYFKSNKTKKAIKDIINKAMEK